VLNQELEAASKRAFRRSLALIATVVAGALILVGVLLTFQVDRFRPGVEEAVVVMTPEPPDPVVDPEIPQGTDKVPSVPEVPSQTPNDSATTVEEKPSDPVLSQRVNETREQFKGALRDFSEEIEPAMNDLGFSSWEAGSKARVLSKKDLAIDAFAQGAFGKALSLLGEARGLAESELRRHEGETEAAFQAAVDAYAEDNYDGAKANIEKAIRWRPRDGKISLLGEKIGKMPALLEHLRAADGKRHENDLDGELKELQAALNLDPDRNDIKSRERALSKLILERRFSKAIQSGLDAVGRGDLSVASKELGTAKSIAPSRKEVSFLEGKIQVLDRNLQVASLIEKAALFVERDEWEGARLQYEAARSIEPENFLVDQGYRRAVEIVALQDELSNFVSAHQRLASPNVAKLARGAISRAQRLSGFSAKLRQTRDRLEILLGQYGRAVDVLVISDGLTSVSVRSVGTVGVTQGREIQLKPGPYTFEGRRQGYKSKLIRVVIPPGVSRFEVKVISDEPI
jgi:tetratricopeptide (TPR) repeat protein